MKELPEKEMLRMAGVLLELAPDLQAVYAQGLDAGEKALRTNPWDPLKHKDQHRVWNRAFVMAPAIGSNKGQEFLRKDRRWVAKLENPSSLLPKDSVTPEPLKNSGASLPDLPVPKTAPANVKGTPKVLKSTLVVKLFGMKLPEPINTISKGLSHAITKTYQTTWTSGEISYTFYFNKRASDPEVGKYLDSVIKNARKYGLTRAAYVEGNKYVLSLFLSPKASKEVKSQTRPSADDARKMTGQYMGKYPTKTVKSSPLRGRDWSALTKILERFFDNSDTVRKVLGKFQEVVKVDGNIPNIAYKMQIWVVGRLSGEKGSKEFVEAMQKNETEFLDALVSAGFPRSASTAARESIRKTVDALFEGSTTLERI